MVHETVIFKQGLLLEWKAEGVGFEPTRSFWPLRALQARAFVRSAIPPMDKNFKGGNSSFQSTFRSPSDMKLDIAGMVNGHKVPEEG